MLSAAFSISAGVSELYAQTSGSGIGNMSEYSSNQIAQSSEASAFAVPVIAKIKTVILYPLISLMMAIALLVFLWGVFQYIANAEGDEARATGRRHMLFGIIGLVVMVSAYAILEIATGTFGIGIPE